jgi:hypothetical protein
MAAGSPKENYITDYPIPSHAGMKCADAVETCMNGVPATIAEWPAREDD